MIDRWPIWFRAALLKSMLSVALAFVVALVVYASPYRQAGSDASQRFFVASPALGGALGHDEHRVEPQKWVLIDLGQDFCRPRGRVDCPPFALRTEMKELARLVDAIVDRPLAERPRLLIIDIEPPIASEQDCQDARAALGPGAVGSAPSAELWVGARERGYDGVPSRRE